MCIKQILIPALLIGVLISVGSCTQTSAPEKPSSTAPTAKEVGEKIEDAVETTGEFAVAKVEEFRSETEVELKKLQDRLATYRSRLSQMSESPRAEREKTLEDLDKQLDSADTMAKNLSSKTKDAWDDAKRGMDQALTDLKKAFDDAASKFEPMNTASIASV
jgi:ElaB/YqjD/DUF883 family membrane-anchored ribosome-binding protein